MNKIEKIKAEFETKSNCQSAILNLKSANYIYKSIVTKENQEALDDLIDLLIAVYYKESKSESKRSCKSPIIREFYEYLLKSGKSDKTSYDYAMRINRVSKEDGVSIEDLVNNLSLIDSYINDFSPLGKRREANLKQHNALLASFKQLWQFVYSKNE